MSKVAAERALEQFNDNDWSAIEPYFHTFENFYKFLAKYGLDEELNFSNIPEDFENQYLGVMLQTKPEKTLDYITNNLVTDVDKRGSDYYLHLKDREELSFLFRESSRGESSRYVAKSVLGEDWWEPYDSTTDDVYRDVYEDLTPDNKQYLSQAVLEEISKEKIEPKTDELESLAEEQGHPEYVELTTENIKSLMDDEETGNYLLKIADNVKSEMYSVHNSSYNNAYSDEVYDDVWSELSTFFEGRVEDVARQVKKNDGTEVTRYDSYIKLRDFPGTISKFLSEFPTISYSTDSLGYYGTYIGVLQMMMDESVLDWLDFRIPDYPDFRKTTQYINDALRDYI
jgi:hypothetical protein